MTTLADIQACVVMATYNNSKTLQRVLNGVLEHSQGRDVIVVNDGSTDDTSAILHDYGDKIILVEHFPNRGKGYALRQGFKEAIERGFKHAITIDSDGQHFPDDIPVFIQGAIDHPGALLMGARDMDQPGIPQKSSFGNKFSNFWYKFETGIDLPDTQTGYRLYPLEPLSKIRLFTTKFETEIEVIVKLAWRQVDVLPVKVKVLYDMDERVTHFRPWQDFTRISILNTYLVILTLLWHLPKRVIRIILKRGLFNIIRQEAVKPEEKNFTKAISVGFGFFMGIVPLWGLQLLIGIPLSIMFRMNKVLFVAAANISIPPMIPFIIFASYFVGGYFVENKVTFNSVEDITLAAIHLNVVQYATGAVVFAIAAGLVSFLLTYAFLATFRKDPSSIK